MAKSLLLLECLLCRNKFEATDVEKGLYFLATCICKECYKKAQSTPAHVWCFGKLPVKRLPGFSENNSACTSLCPDRAICRKFINKLKE